MAAVFDSQTTNMASFFTSVRKAHCINIDLRTPPPSPESNGSSKHTGSRLRLSRYLQRGDKRSPKTIRGTNGGSSPSCGKYTSKSPPRAITEMKEPFPLMLPDSPALTDEDLHNDEKQRLRRISASHKDLRALARVQSPAAANETRFLLPSPMFRTDKDSPGEDSYFAYPNPSDTPVPEIGEDPDDPYEVHGIISGYCNRERWSLLLDEVRQSKQASLLRHASSTWAQAGRPAPASPQPTTPPSQPRKRDRAWSNESDWLASNTSPEERNRRFKQRCCGMIQHQAQWSVPARSQNEDEIMLATVLIGPGKPKLVQIRRSQSGTSRSSQSRISQSGTASAGGDSTPTTPLQAKKEISVFSPYDTPCQRTYGAMMPSVDFISSSDSLQRLRPAPLSIPPCNTQHRIDSAIYVTNQNEDDLASSESTSTPPSYNSSASLSAPPRHPTRCHSLSRVQARNLKPSTALDMITSAIDAFPSTLLHLDSPLVRQFRNTDTTSHAYVSRLQQIFPNVSPLLLSALAAWWLVDRYLTEQFSLLSSSPQQPKKTKDGLSQQYRDICAVSNESLHHIPSKARRMLGIQSPEEEAMCSGRREQRATLRHRGRLVHVSVRVIAQRLMEVVNANGGWVEELWRACGVVVAMIDAGDGRSEVEVGEDGEGEREEEEWL